MSDDHQAPPSGERPRLKLLPRGTGGAATTGGASSGKANPFGAARPREEILKSKGVDLTDRFKKDWSRERTSDEQVIVDEIASLVEAIKVTEDAEKRTELEGDKTAKEEELAKMAAEIDSKKVDRTKFMRPSERRAQQQQQDGQGGQQGGQGGDDRQGGGNYNQNYGRRSSGNCYNCGQEGHMSRECSQPRSDNRGGGGGGGGGGGNCYNCQQPGHLARECPSGGGGYGGRSGGGRDSGYGGGRDSGYGGGRDSGYGGGRDSGYGGGRDSGYGGGRDSGYGGGRDSGYGGGRDSGYGGGRDQGGYGGGQDGGNQQQGQFEDFSNVDRDRKWT